VSDEELIRRAVAAFWRTSGPGATGGRAIEHDGKRYVVVTDERGTALATFRVRPVDGVLRRMKRPPAEVTEG
jgi:hypothetical protein